MPKLRFTRVEGFEAYLIERIRALNGDQQVRLYEFLDALHRGTEPRNKEQTAKVLYLAAAKREAHHG